MIRVAFAGIMVGMALSGSALAGPDIVAHRGASHDAPENTLAAFRLAWQQDADAIEGDFHLSKDGRVVCIHDASTKRTADRDLKVAESTLAELQKLDVGSRKAPEYAGERIPTLEDVLATVPAGKRIFIEIKCGPEILPGIEKALLAARLKPEQAVIICFKADIIAAAKKRLPDRKAMWLTSLPKGKTGDNRSPAAKSVLAELDRIEADGVDCNAQAGIEKDFAQALRQAGREFHIWTVDSPAVAKHFAQLGVDSITTNRPAFLREQLGQTPPSGGK